MKGNDIKFSFTLTDGSTIESESVRVYDGLDAFEVWSADNPGSTKEEYYAAMRGKDGFLPPVPADDLPVMIDADQFITMVQAAAYNDRVIPDAAEQEAYYTSIEGLTVTASIVKIPGDGGHYVMAYGPAQMSPAAVGTFMYWVPEDDTQQVTVVFESKASLAVPFVSSTGFQGQGTEDDPFTTVLSQASGNALSIVSDGLFAAVGGLPTLPEQFMMPIDISDFDQRVNDVMNLEVSEVPAQPTTEKYSESSSVGTYLAYITIIPVGTAGYWVIADGIVHDEPAMLRHVAFYRDMAQNYITYIYDQNMLWSENTLTIHSTDASVMVTANDTNDEFDLKAKTLTRGTGGGNFSFGYPDNKSAANACGHLGTGVYWKVTISLSAAGAGNTNVPVSVWMKAIPCLSDGTPVSHRIVVDYATAITGNSIPTAAVWLICDVPPTHLIDITTGTITQLYRSASSDTTGLPEYPTPPDGQLSNEPSYSRQYFYDAFTS